VGRTSIHKLLSSKALLQLANLERRVFIGEVVYGRREMGNEQRDERVQGCHHALEGTDDPNSSAQ
jgi:hypothetical protein